MSLTGRKAIVTGSGRGLGFGIAKKLAQEGAFVCICDVDKTGVDKAVKQLKEAGSNVIGMQVDVSDSEQVYKVLENFINEYGALDIMVNNAGINQDAMLHKMTLEQWDKVISINLNGTFYFTQGAAKHMREKGYGRIVNISSASWLGNIGQANYAASKAGVVGLTKTAARELARKGVTVNAICPGFIKTDMTTSIPEKVWDIMISKIPAGRAGEPADVANMVAFLCSNEAEYITGEVINVGGGMVL
jgi:3-oxoacyl-[acyl-carrier protein] reductase/2-hydroxycyclohexanecarboxyl-CoA dehydrogenase